MRRLGLALLVIALAAPAFGQAACTHYAAPGVGAGHAGTQGDPFRISDFWAVASAGKVLCLNDGVYQGDAQMIRPPNGLSGTNGNPITIRAINDGGALIDGQFARQPLSFNGSSWFVLENFNLKSSSGYVAALNFNSNNNVFRRLVLWDGNFTSGGVWLMQHSANNLLEDVALFGTGVNIFHNYGTGSTGNVLRRVWARWEGSSSGNLKRVISMSYDNGPAITCENCLATWTAESMPQSYTLSSDGQGGTVGQPYSNFQVHAPMHLIRTGIPDDATPCVNAKVYGSLAYLKATAAGQPSARGNDHPLIGLGSHGQSCVDFNHAMFIMPSTHPAFNIVLGFALGHTWSGITNTVARNLTSVRGPSDVVRYSYNPPIPTHFQGTTLASVPNPWTTTQGANLCKRWHGGAVTSMPLWPWPMNERIKAATASAGSYSGPCNNCVGGRLPRTATDVTAEVEALLGPIPAECRSDVVTPPPIVAVPTVQYTLDEKTSGACSELVDSGDGTALNLTCSTVTP